MPLQGCAPNDPAVHCLRVALEQELVIMSVLGPHPNILTPIARAITTRSGTPSAVEPIGLIMQYQGGGTLYEAYRCQPLS